VVGVSLAALAAGTFAIVAFGALAPELEATFGLTRAEIGFLTSLVFIGSMITSRPAGKLTDSIGPTRVLFGALVLFAGGMAFAALARSTVVFMLAVLLAGLAYGGINPPTNVVVAGQLGRRLGFFLSVKQSGVPLGGLLAGVALPPIAVAFGWRWALAVTVVACIAVAAATPLLRNAAVLRGSSTVLGEPSLRRREMIAIGFFGFVMAGSQWTVFTYLTLFLTEDLGFTLGVAGLALGLAQGVGAGGRLIWGWLSDSPGRRLVILVAVALLSAGLLAALAGGAGEVALWPIVAALGLALVGWNGAYHALVAERAGPGRIGKASGNALVFVFGGAVALPPLLGLLGDALDSWPALWGVDAAVMVIAALVLAATLGSPVRAASSPRPLDR
jgi:MFS family permease